ncbi:MAG: UbiA family prenyltransferase [Chloroflexi bacterium]|nr:UbiA family prenyltransferase [Chloroflexota bacterium]
MSILRISRPLYLLIAALTYILGAGIARYLGAVIQWPALLLGLLAILSLLTASSLLAEYFRLPFIPLAPDETPRLRERGRMRLLQVSYAALTLSGAAVVTLLLVEALGPSAAILLALAALLLVAYAVPPLRLSEAGYGELALSIFLATLLPAFSFLLQANEFHRLLPLTAFPLTLLAIAWLLASNFSTFAADQKQGRRSLLIRLTWQRAVPLHHILVLTAFLLFASAPFFGVSWGLIWPVFLALPFALWQIYWLQRIASGGKPVWKFFTLLVPAVFGLTVYLLALSFWLR